MIFLSIFSFHVLKKINNFCFFQKKAQNFYETSQLPSPFPILSR